MKILSFLSLVSLLCWSSVAFAADEAALNSAVTALNAKATDDLGKRMVIASVAQETGQPAKAIEAQHRSTNLSYGDLLVANSLAAGSGKSLPEVLALKSKGKGWAQVSTDLKINSRSLVARLQHARSTIEYTKNTSKPRSQRMLMQDAEFDKNKINQSMMNTGHSGGTGR